MEANQNSIPIRDVVTIVVGEVVLNLEGACVADFAVIRLRPKLRCRSRRPSVAR